jgi:hypothetical protein
MLKRFILFFTVLSCLLGCGDREEASKLEVLRSEPGFDTDAELMRKRAMQAITIIDPDGARSQVDTIEFITDVLNGECANRWAAASSSQDAPWYQCRGGDGLTWMMVCTAGVLHDVARGTPISIAREPGSNVRYSVDPQPLSARASIVNFLPTLEAWSLRQLSSVSTDIQDCAKKSAYAAMVADSARSLLGLEDVLADLLVQVSEAERVSSGDRELAAYRSLTAMELSRFAAVRLLLGGYADEKNGEHFTVPGAGVGFCTESKLSGPAQKALSVIRQSGISPAVILASPEFTPNMSGTTITTDQMVTGTSIGGGSVYKRIEAKMNTVLGGSAFLRSLGLEIRDFHDARRYLAQELTAFSRSTVQLTQSVAGGSNYDFFAAVETPLGNVDPSYYAAIARSAPHFRQGDSDDPDGDGYTAGQEWKVCSNGARSVYVKPSHRVGLNSLRSAITDAIACAAAETPDSTASSGDLAPLTSLATEMRREFEGRLRVYHHYLPTGGQYRYDLTKIYLQETENLVDPYMIVRGEDALSCYTTGLVEGVPCSGTAQAQGNEWIVTSLSNDGGEYVGYIPSSQWHGVKERWYLVRAKVSDAAPGSWRSVLGFQFSVPANPAGQNASIGYSYRDYPIYRDIEARASRILAPSKDWCAEPQDVCLGLGSKDPLPLEDELTDDGLSDEGSWRHYLELAKEAAAESDRLAQEYLSVELGRLQNEVAVEENQIQREQAAIAHMERVQEICGTSIDPSPMVKALGGYSGAYSLEAGALGGSCSVSNAPPLNTGLTCVGGRWIRGSSSLLRSVTNDGALAPLKECLLGDALLGENATIPYVHFGDVGLCVPKDAIDGKCGGVNLPPCKRAELAKKANESAPESCNNNTEWVLVPANAGLGFFSTRDIIPESEDTNVCSSVRRVRADHKQTDVNRIKRSPWLALPELQALAKSTQVSVEPGMYVSVQVGDSFWRTGSLSAGPQTSSWPCAQNQIQDGCPSSNAFGCKSYDCSTFDGRALAARRLLDAALAVKVSLSDKSFERLEYPVPYQINYGGKPSKSDPETVHAWRPAPLDPIPIKRYSGGAWTTYEANLSNGEWPENIVWESKKGTTWGWRTPLDIKDSAFGFRMQKAKSDPVDARYFWAGVGAQGKFEGETEGCILKALLGEANPMEKCGKDTRFEVVENCDCWDYEGTGTQKCRGTSGSEFWPSEVGLKDFSRPHYCPSDVVEMPFIGSESRIFIHKDHAGTFLDGLELLCMAQEKAPQHTGCDVPKEPIRRIEDLGRTGSYLQCLGNKLAYDAATTVLRDLPKSVVDPFRRSGSSVWAVSSGEIGVALSDLRTELMNVYSAQSAMAHTVSQFGYDMVQLEAAFKGYASEEELAGLEAKSVALTQSTNCIAAMATTTDANLVAAAGKATAAAAVCINSVAQTLLAELMSEAKAKGVEAAKEGAMARFNQGFEDKVKALDEQSVELSKAFERINTKIGVVADLRREAERKVADALWAMAREVKSLKGVSKMLGNQKSLAFERYMRAEKNAKRLSYLAKRAIEQRLGVSLDEMTDALPLVEAPATWHAKICSSNGVDFASFGKAKLDDRKIAGVADGFVGDYVKKLENVVESYRLTNGFQDGSDRSVISLRDDLLDLKQPCEVPSRNLFVNSADLKIQSNEWSSETPGWYAEGCRSESNSEGSSPIGNCLATTRIGELFRPTGAEEAVEGFEIRFGTGGTGQGAICSSDPELPCGWQSEVKLTQRVVLEPGNYAMSWYERASSADNDVVEPRIRALSASQVSPLYQGVSGPSSRGWKKRWAIYRIENDGTYEAGLSAGEKGGFPFTGTGIVAAPMLERLPDGIGSNYEDLNVGFFQATDSNGTTTARVCPDRDGREFRSRWTHGCLKVCPDGYSSDCSAAAEESCYHELIFPLSQRGIETGGQLSVGGFAKGNFNYRLHQIGVNVVGTGVRACSDASSGAACSGAGFVTYTLLHEGPYLVRNHQGEDFVASLREGRIEHARALGLERYITNPVSSTDESLLENYMRREMSGRPLDGNFVLRIWDDDGVDFSAIEDVQLVVDYGYWTRQD